MILHDIEMVFLGFSILPGILFIHEIKEKCKIYFANKIELQDKIKNLENRLEHKDSETRFYKMLLIDNKIDYTDIDRDIWNIE